jgi:hypothetical protein
MADLSRREPWLVKLKISSPRYGWGQARGPLVKLVVRATYPQSFMATVKNRSL